MRTRSPYPLFQPKTLKKRIATFGFPADLPRRASKIVKWLKYINDGNQPDDLSDAEFLHDLFVDVLGYRSPFSEDERGWEFEFQPSPALGFFWADSIQVVAEIFIHAIDRPIQPQYESTEWLIAIDYKLLRLYHKSKPELFYQQFRLEKLVVDADYLRQFYFILCRRTLLAGIPHSQERSRILQLLEESHNAEMVIARDFYSYYQRVRSHLVKDFRHRLHQLVEDTQALSVNSVTPTPNQTENQETQPELLINQQRNDEPGDDTKHHTDRHAHDQPKHSNDRKANHRRNQKPDQNANQDPSHSLNPNSSANPNQSTIAGQSLNLTSPNPTAKHDSHGDADVSSIIDPGIKHLANSGSAGHSESGSVTPSSSIASTVSTTDALISGEPGNWFNNPDALSPTALAHLAITQVQKLLNRVLFIAAGEDRQLFPPNLLKDAYEFENPYVHQPAWENYKAIFNWVYAGVSRLNLSIPAYGSSLFVFDPLLDRDLFVGDEFCRQLKELTRFDFSEDISNTAIAYILEETLRDLILLRQEVETGEAPKRRKLAFPPRSLLRSDYIPAKLAQHLNIRVAAILSELSTSDRHDLPADAISPGDNIEIEAIANTAESTSSKSSSEASPPVNAKPRMIMLSDRSDLAPEKPELPPENDPETRLKFWQAYYQALTQLRVVAPRCGSGVSLAVAFDFLLGQNEIAIQEIRQLNPDRQSLQKPPQAIDTGEIVAQILRHNLYGCDPSIDAIETTKFHLWLRSASLCKSLLPLEQNIRAGDLQSSGLAQQLETATNQGNLITLPA
jgi:hypothetical protein